MCVCENSATGIVSTFAIFRVLWTAQNSVLQFLARFFPVPETMLTDVAALTLVEETGNITAGSVGLGIVKNVEPGENGERVARAERTTRGGGPAGGAGGAPLADAAGRADAAGGRSGQGDQPFSAAYFSVQNASQDFSSSLVVMSPSSTFCTSWSDFWIHSVHQLTPRG